MSEAYPRLRDVDVFPIEHEGETRFAFRDPYEFKEGTLILSVAGYFVAACLNGKNTAGHIQAAFNKQFQTTLPTEIIEKVVQALDEHFLLDNERFQQRSQLAADEFAQASVRTATHAGSVYSSNPIELRKQLSEHFKPPAGPGLDALPTHGRLRGLVVPHIDYGRGAAGYAWAYREILGRDMADLYVILGVAHMSPPSPFVLTSKDYDTPMGAVETDKDLAAQLALDLDWDPFKYEIVHRKEHSIEFQSVYLRYCAAHRKRKFLTLPILVSGLAGADKPDDAAGASEQTRQFLDSLARMLRSYGASVCLVAGVDLSHIGRRFGDDFDVTPEKLAWMEREDRASLERVLAKDARGWYGAVAPRGHNERKVCGLGALYAFTYLLKELYPESKGELLHYGHAADPTGGEVSFASMRFLSKHASRP